MGISVSIFCGEVARVPADILLTMICDNHRSVDSLFVERGPDMQYFRSDDGFIGCYRDAMAAGWKDVHRGGRRIFLGPCCSGKEPKDGSGEDC